MLEFIATVFTQPLGSFAFVMGSFMIFFWCTVKVTTLVATHKADKDNFNSSLKEVKDAQQLIATNISDISGTLRYISDNVLELKERVKKLENDKYSEVKSPIKINDEGEQVMKLLDAESLVQSHWEYIKSYLDEKLQDPTPYDIQEESFMFNFIGILTSEELQTIKKVAFERGDTIEDYDIIFGIIIRNKYLYSKGIDVSQFYK